MRKYYGDRYNCDKHINVHCRVIIFPFKILVFSQLSYERELFVEATDDWHKQKHTICIINTKAP